MPNFGSTLKSEIQRLAQKEIRAATSGLKKASTQHRRDIAGLKRENASLVKKIAFLEGQERKRVANTKAPKELADGLRFSAKGLKSHRRKLKLSAKDYGRLVGASSLSVYNWERGDTKPRKPQIAALLAVRGMGKREAVARLKMLA